MPSYHADYTLYPRKLKCGKPVYYYRTYTPEGKRTSGLSTGCTTKRAANAYCIATISRAVALPTPIAPVPIDTRSFTEYATDFFSVDSRWHQDTYLCDTTIKKEYGIKLRAMLRNHIVPYFGGCTMSDIVPSKIKDFRLHLKDKGLANKTINIIASVALKQVTDTAVNDGVLLRDPFRGVKRLEASENERDAFTLDEAKRLLSGVWCDDNHRAMSVVAACTGMRIAEVLAIRKETVTAQYIEVADQRNAEEFSETKGKQKRKVPLCPALRALIMKQFTAGSTLAFPLSAATYRNHLYRNFSADMNTEKKERNLSFHSWRHFFNTYLLSENVAPHKVAAVMGHSTGIGSVQECYTNWKPDMFPEVYAAQKKLFALLL